MKEFWCSECGQECRWGDGGNTKPPRCRLHRRSTRRCGMSPERIQLRRILRGVTWRHVPQDRPASAA